jgi:hypothetical protein
MRRILHSVLVLFLAAGLVAPLSTDGAAAAQTPICCLRNGEHHCLGMAMAAGSLPAGFSKASEKCPYAPLALAAMYGPKLAPPLAATALLAPPRTTAITPGTQTTATSFQTRTQSERGPPTSSSLD